MSESPTRDSPEESADHRPAHLHPTGISAVELAARRGIGPLSPLGKRVWHGEARPCVSCGQLVPRTQEVCDQCGQDMSRQMLEKMRRHSGPWYVLEHVRPFPGVSLERLVRQIRRGVLTPTTVVRGPTTYHQWRFAAETPVLSKYLGCCWACQAEVSEADRICRVCRADLDADISADGTVAADLRVGRRPAVGGDAQPGEIEKLSAALGVVPTATRARAEGRPATVGRVRVSWVVAALFVLTLAAIFAVVRIRAGAAASSARTAPADENRVVAPAPTTDQPAPPPGTKPSS